MKRTLATCLLPLAILLVFTGGCDSLRFAPSESQKAAAWQTNRIAIAAHQAGLPAASEASQQLVAGTTVALSYTGLPDDVSDLTDPAAINAMFEQAANDAAKRPTGVDILDTAETGLGIIEIVAGLLGAGGITLGGRAVTAWIAKARQAKAAAAEIIKGSENFLNSTSNEGAIADFKAAQKNVQSAATKKLVAEQRVAIKT